MTESAPATQQAITTASRNLNVSCPWGQLLVGGGFPLDQRRAPTPMEVHLLAMEDNGPSWLASYHSLELLPSYQADGLRRICVALLATI